MTDHSGFLDQTRMQRLFTQLDIVRGRWDQTDNQRRADPHTITQRSVDEAQTAGHRIYTAAGTLITAALDNVDALRTLLGSGAAVGPWAPYNLIRGAFLPAVWAIWMLEPLDSKERRIRGLRFAVVDEKEWEAFRSTFPSDAEQAAHWAAKHAEVTKIYHDEADQLGLQWSVARTAINLVAELPKLETLRKATNDGMATVVGLWRGMSGIAHGYGYAVQAFSDVRIDRTTDTGASVTTFSTTSASPTSPTWLDGRWCRQSTSTGRGVSNRSGPQVLDRVTKMRPAGAGFGRPRRCGGSAPTPPALPPRMTGSAAGGVLGGWFRGGLPRLPDTPRDAPNLRSTQGPSRCAVAARALARTGEPAHGYAVPD